MNNVPCVMDGRSMADCHDCVLKESFGEVASEIIAVRVPPRICNMFAPWMARASHPL